jgi:hypothetical protein
LSQQSDGSSSSSSSRADKEQSDSLLISAALKQRLLHPADEAPLTTRAVRDLQKLKNERVYSRALVKVRLPDKTQLSAYFHPREGMWEVYAWLSDSLSPALLAAAAAAAVDGEAGQEATGGAKQAAAGGRGGRGNKSGPSLPEFPFELYVAPPRQVLRPVAPWFQTGSQDKGDGGEAVDITSLSALHLSPAALLNLSWTSAAAAAVAAQAPGAAFREELLGAADRKGPGEPSFPVGESLLSKVVDQKDTRATGGSKLGAAAAGGAEGDSEADAKPISKPRPKWLKI